MNNRDEEIYENLKEGKINVAEMDSPLLACCKYHACSYPQDLYTHYPSCLYWCLLSLLTVYEHKIHLLTEAFFNISSLV